MEVTAEEGKELLGNPFNWGELSKAQAETEKKEEEARAEKERKKEEKAKKQKVVPEASRKSSRIAKKDTEPKAETPSEEKPASKKGKGKKEAAKKEIKRVPSVLAEELAKGNARAFTKENARNVKDSAATAKKGKGKGASLYEELQLLEHAPLDSITFESSPNPQIAGNWQLTYEGYNQDNKLDINADGTFLQHAGNYKGVWRSAGHLLVLEYSDIKLPGETESIKLQSELAQDFTTLRGSKSHPNYPKGVLVYVAHKVVEKGEEKPVEKEGEKAEKEVAKEVEAKKEGEKEAEKKE